MYAQTRGEIPIPSDLFDILNLDSGAFEGSIQQVYDWLDAQYFDQSNDFIFGANQISFG